MLLVDHKNPVIKLTLICALGVAFVIGAIKTGHISLSESQETSQKSTNTIVPAYRGHSQAFRNPVTGAFEHRPAESTSSTTIASTSSVLMSSRALVASNIAAGVVEEFNGAQVIAMPARMKTHLVATRTPEGMEVHHETVNASVSNKDDQ